MHPLQGFECIDFALRLVNKGFRRSLIFGSNWMYTRESAEVLALQVLAWLAANEELLPVFLGSTGASEQDLRQGARDPAFLGSVLDFLTMDDTWVVQCCDSIGVAYTAPLEARQALPGGEQINWT